MTDGIDSKHADDIPPIENLGGIDDDGLQSDEDGEDGLKNDTYLLCVGLKTVSRKYSGNKLVDMIMKLQKIVKYLPIGIRTFNQWICLREINCDLKSMNKRVRCAIQLSPFPKYDDEFYREEWGWDEKYRGSWVAYEITKVKLLPCTIFTQQYRMGSFPFRLSLDEKFHESTTKILLALKYGTNATHTMNGEVRQLKYQRLKAREEQRKLQQLLRDKMQFYVEKNPKKPTYKFKCCKNICMHEFGCGVEQLGSANDNTSIFQWVRTKFHSLSAKTQREFMSNRMTSKGVSETVKTNKSA